MKRYSVLPIIVCWLILLFVIGTVSSHQQLQEEKQQAEIVDPSTPPSDSMESQVSYTESQN